MPRKVKFGPIGNGWVVLDQKNNQFVAKWQRQVQVPIPDPDDPPNLTGRKTLWGGQYVLGPFDPKGRKKGSLSSLESAKTAWLKICERVMNQDSASSFEASTEGTAKPHEWTYQDYCEQVWLPARKEHWNDQAETEENVNYYLKTHLYKKFGDRSLSSFTKSDIQGYLTHMATKGNGGNGYSRTVINHLKFYLCLPLQYAREKGVIAEDPTVGLIMPKKIRREKRPALKFRELVALSKEMPTPRDQIMLELLYFGALRRGELFAIRWNRLGGNKLYVLTQIRKKKGEGLPKNRQEGDQDSILIPSGLIEKLADYKRWCGKVAPDEYIFPSRRNTPINYKNWEGRVLKPAGQAAGIESVTFVMCRRGMATIMRKGARQRAMEEDDKIKTHLRHNDLQTARDHYIQDDDEEEEAIRLEELNMLYERYLRALATPLQIVSGAAS